MFKFRVTPDDGDGFEVTATSRDIVMWEKTGKGNSLHRLTENLRMTDMYSLAHVASRRQGMFDGTLADFMDSVDLDLDDILTAAQDGDDDEAGPTNPGR